MNPALINKLQNLKKRYLKEGFEIVGIFGSYARGEEDLYSDIDIAYKLNHNKFYKDDAFEKLFRLEEIQNELEKNLKKRVDIVSLNSPNERLKNEIEKEIIKIWKTESNQF